MPFDLRRIAHRVLALLRKLRRPASAPPAPLRTPTSVNKDDAGCWEPVSDAERPSTQGLVGDQQPDIEPQRVETKQLADAISDNEVAAMQTDDQPPADDGEGGPNEPITAYDSPDGQTRAACPASGENQPPRHIPNHDPQAGRTVGKEGREQGQSAGELTDAGAQLDPVTLPPEAGTHVHEENAGGNHTDRPTRPDEAASKSNRKRPKPPTAHGGKRGRRPSSSETRSRSYAPRPELICRENGLQWEVALSAGDDCWLEAVEHNGAAIATSNRECGVPSFAGHLTISYNGGNGARRLELPLHDDKPMIFKLGPDWSSPGRQVAGITHGHFIVIVPSSWTRTGHPRVEPQDCIDSDFRAHFFYRSKSGSDDGGGFNEYERPLTRTAADLEGNVIFDDSTMGILFGGPKVPRLNAPGVVWARVGEEGTKGWGCNFKPTEQTLPDVLGDRQGRFFVRVYDSESNMLDSSEFRYLRTLNEIQVNGEQYTDDSVLVPSPTGHAPTEVRFVGIDGTPRLNPIVQVEGAAVAEGDGAVVEPHPDADAFSCTLASESGSVEVTLHLPRIWWRMELEGGEHDGWLDKPLDLTRQQFVEYADAGAAIHVRLPRRIQAVAVGFNDELVRSYRPRREDGESNVHLRVPLVDFAYHSQIQQRQAEDVPFNLEFNGAKLPLVLVSRDPLPKIISFTCEPCTIERGELATLSWETLHAESGGVTIDPDVGLVAKCGRATVRPPRSAVYTLRLSASGLDDVTTTVALTVSTVVLAPASPKVPVAHVQGGHGAQRCGAGFSCGELQAAGVATSGAECPVVPIDRRRRTTHPANVAAIRRLIDA